MRSTLASMLRAGMLKCCTFRTWVSRDMMMQDKNNLQVADLILKWIDENVGQAKGR
jgi:hypothetical protein